MTEPTQADRELLEAALETIWDGDARLHIDIEEGVLRAIAKARAQGWEAGLRAAAEVCEDAIEYHKSPECRKTYCEAWQMVPDERRREVESVRDDILALIEKEKPE